MLQENTSPSSLASKQLTQQLGKEPLPKGVAAAPANLLLSHQDWTHGPPSAVEPGRGQGVEGDILDDDGLVLISLLQTSVISWGNSRLSLEGLNWRWWPAAAKPQLEGNYVFFLVD